MTVPPLPTAPQIGSTGFQQTPGIAEQIAPFLQMLIQKEELGLRKERLKLDKQEMESRLSQQAMESQNQSALGQALLQTLIPTETVSAGLPDFALGPTFPQQLQGLTPAGQAAQSLPSQVVPAFVEQSRDLRAEGRHMRAVGTAIERTVKPEHREAARALATYQLRGVDLPLGVQQALYPDLFPAGVDPQTMNAALRYGVAGMKWGQVRSLFNLPKNPLIADDFEFPMSRDERQSDKQLTASLHYDSMVRNGPIIDQMIAATGGVSIPAHVYRTLQATQASSGGVTGLLANLAGTGINWVLSPEQQQLVQAQFAFTNSYRYLVSGQQTSDREFIVILNTIAENPGDSPEVIAQKRSFRNMMTESAGRLARGEARPAEAAEQLLRQAQTMHLAPEVIAVLQQQVEDAKRYQGTGQATPYLPRDPTDANSPASLEQVRRLIDGIGRRNFIMGNP